MTSLWDFPDFDEHELVHFVTDRRHRPQRDHRGPFHPSRARRRRHALLALCRARRRGRRRAAAVARDELQERDGRPADGRRQGGDPRRRRAQQDARSCSPRSAGRSTALGGRYVTAEDVGINVADMVAIAKQTRFVAGLPVAEGAVGGDPGPHTSYGVFLGVKAAVKRKLGKDSLAGLHSPSRARAASPAASPGAPRPRAPGSASPTSTPAARPGARGRDRRRRSSPPTRS